MIKETWNFYRVGGEFPKNTLKCITISLSAACQRISNSLFLFLFLLLPLFLLLLFFLFLFSFLFLPFFLLLLFLSLSFPLLLLFFLFFLSFPFLPFFLLLSSPFLSFFLLFSSPFLSFFLLLLFLPFSFPLLLLFLPFSFFLLPFSFPLLLLFFIFTDFELQTALLQLVICLYWRCWTSLEFFFLHSYLQGPFFHQFIPIPSHNIILVSSCLNKIHPKALGRPFTNFRLHLYCQRFHFYQQSINSSPQKKKLYTTQQTRYTKGKFRYAVAQKVQSPNT